MGPAGYVQDLWRDGELAKAWGFKPSPENTSIFLCGNPAMIDDMMEILEDQGFREHTRKVPGHIFVERYW